MILFIIVVLLTIYQTIREYLHSDKLITINYSVSLKIIHLMSNYHIIFLFDMFRAALLNLWYYSWYEENTWLTHNGNLV